jgi:hypothetical protein
MKVAKDKEQGASVQRIKNGHAQKRAKAWKTVLSTREGRMVVWEILKFTKLFAEAFTGNSQTFYNEGRQSVGKWIYKRIDPDNFDEYIEMRREAQRREAAEQEEIDNA